VLLTQYCASDKIKKNEMGGACGAYVRGMNRVLVGKPDGKDNWGDPGTDGRIILRWIFMKWGYGLG
jgi:hypothetical protein